MIMQHRLAAQRTSEALPDLQVLHEFLTKEIQIAEVSNNVARLVELHLLQALAWYAMNRLSKARESLLNALKVGMPGGYIRLFVDEGEAVQIMLR